MQRYAALIPYLALTIAMLVWGSSFIALKYAFMSYDSMWVIFWRLVFGSLFFALFIPKMNLPAFRAQDLGALLGMALLEPCLYFVFESKAIENTTASQAGMISSMLPVMVALLAVWILKERLKARTLLGFLLAMGGAVGLSLTSEGSDYAPNPLLGNFLEFIAMMCAAFYTILVKHLSQRYNALFLTGFQTIVGALFFGILTLFNPLGEPMNRGELHTGAILATLYLGVVVSFIGYGLYNYSLSKVKASLAAGFTNLIPLFSLLLGYLLLGETLNAMQGIACAVIFIGVLIAFYEKRA